MTGSTLAGESDESVLNIKARQAWHFGCTLSGMVERYLLVFLAGLLGGSIGAFFLYVPILPIIGVATTLIGLVAMFLLGFHAGHQQTALTTQRYTGRPSFWSLWKHAR